MKLIVILTILLIPTEFEVIRDRKGDIHPNSDWKIRALLCATVGMIVTLAFTFQETYIDFIRVSVVYTISSGLLFASVFPYWVNFVHLKNGVTTYNVHGKGMPYSLLTKWEVAKHVLQHLSQTAWPDKTWWWRWIGVGGRFVVNFILLVIAILLACANSGEFSFF